MRKCKECGYIGNNFLKGFLICNDCVERNVQNTDITSPPKFTDLKVYGENYDKFQVIQIESAIKSWIHYFNQLGRYFEKRGNQERADRHYVQAIAFETFLGEVMEE